MGFFIAVNMLYKKFKHLFRINTKSLFNTKTKKRSKILSLQQKNLQKCFL